MRFWFIPACYFILALLSTLTLSSVAPQLAGRQLIFFIVGAGLLYASSQFSFARLITMRWPLYIAGCIALLIPLILSEATRNTTRWISIGSFFTIQPSQLAVFFSIFALTALLTQTKQFSWLLLGKFLVLLGIPSILILVEPDLGSTIVVAIPLLSLVFLVPFSWKKLTTLLIVSCIGAYLAWHFVLHGYQKDRLMSFLQPDSANNYNAHQALIAVGSGKLLGRGGGQGIQSHLRFLPERQTDFIFASFAEENGYIGCVVLILVYMGLVYFLFHVSTVAKTPEEKLYLCVTAITFFLQASVNIHMNLGLLPITGITLPLMSYGGSSVMGLALMLGICQHIAQTAPRKTAIYIS